MHTICLLDNTICYDLFYIMCMYACTYLCISVEVYATCVKIPFRLNEERVSPAGSHVTDGCDSCTVGAGN